MTLMQLFLPAVCPSLTLHPCLPARMIQCQQMDHPMPAVIRPFPCWKVGLRACLRIVAAEVRRRIRPLRQARWMRLRTSAATSIELFKQTLSLLAVCLIGSVGLQAVEPSDLTVPPGYTIEKVAGAPDVRFP